MPRPPRRPLKTPLPKQGGGPDTSLAVIVVQPDAVRPAEGKESYGTYDLFVRARLDDRLVTDLHTGLRDAIVSARLQTSGVDPIRIKEPHVRPAPGIAHRDGRGGTRDEHGHEHAHARGVHDAAAGVGDDERAGTC